MYDPEEEETGSWSGISSVFKYLGFSSPSQNSYSTAVSPSKPQGAPRRKRKHRHRYPASSNQARHRDDTLPNALDSSPRLFQFEDEREMSQAARSSPENVDDDSGAAIVKVKGSHAVLFDL